MPVSHILESSGEGSGFQEGHNELRQGLAPSVSLLEENLIGQELAEKRDNMEDTWFHFAPPSPQRQIQIMDGDGSSAEMSEAQSPLGVSPSTPKQATATQSVPSTTSTLAQIRSLSSNWERAAEAVTTVQNEAFLKTATTQPPPPIPHGKDGEDSVATNSAQKGTDLVPKHSENSTAGGATVVTDQEANPQVTSADSSITTNSQFSHLQSSSDAVTQTIQSNQTGN